MLFEVLGQLEVRRNGQVTSCGGPKHQKILAALLLAFGQPVPVTHLVDVVWEAEPPATAAKQVRNAISDLRRALPPEGPSIEAVTGGYRLDAKGHLDAAAFIRMTERARHRLAAGDDLAAASEFEAALALWRGDVLAGLECPSLQPQVAKLRELRLTVFEEWSDLQLERGNHRALVGELTSWAREHPFRERLTALLMLALYRSGSPAEATLVFQRLERLLREELGVGPSAELKDLHERILANDEALASPRKPLPRSDLPRDTPSFTGRSRELVKLITPAADSEATVPVSAIDGMPGVGKTALAIRAAHRLADRFPDAQLFVDLHAHTPGHPPLSPATALEKLIRALGVDSDRIPHELHERASFWRAQLTNRRVLLVLDNALDTNQVEPLLPGTEGCSVLVTSRKRLTGLDAATLTLDVLPMADARRLLFNVTKDARPMAEPAATTEVLQLCGNLPLAIRIAGARLRHRGSWSVSYLADRLRDQCSRLEELKADDHSVAAAFKLSYDQLRDEHQDLFRMLGTAPYADIEPHAAAALLGLTPAKAEEILEDLLDAHLLEQSMAGRYRLHDLLRSYAADLSVIEDSESQREEAFRRLFEHYLRTAASAMDVLSPTERAHRPALQGGSSGAPRFSDYDTALKWLNVERVNLLTVAAKCATHGPSAYAYLLSATLWRYFHISGYHNDAFMLHTHGIAAARAAGNSRYEADSLASRGYVNWWLGRYEHARNDCVTAARLADTANDRSLEGRALHALGLVYTRLGAHREARATLEETLAASWDTSDRVLEGYALRGLGEVHHRLGDTEAAVSSYEQASAIAREVGNITVEGYAVRALAEIHAGQSEYGKALTHCLRALELARTGKNRNIENRALRTLAGIHRDMGRHELAMQRYREALRLADETGNPYEAACAHDGVGQAHLAQGRTVEARKHWKQAVAIYHELGVPEGDQVRKRLMLLDHGEN
ncbi:hypothetical protein DMC61_21800 [Amycolatopsis sp. WAC 04169]|uniref:AfsR/SARP family transcriptional regulator n=1 Tax=Amycolatopsis sp. WAC 04169 TaxID=2203197 RepID=UPI000F79AAE2|nr:BTAD domain-containing putative transcriptional regulator [Amycolatopsis sp. WAC 04169]RSN29140.1 hypothetical protein DMC61_21800 [Amycolatopsis sp. WAC 04169]